MLEAWNEIKITRIVEARYVSANSGKPAVTMVAHMFLLNDLTGERILHFADGTSVRSGPGEVRFIPKGAVYRIERITPGGCWTILFDTDKDVGEMPFSRPARDYDALLKNFREAAKAANGWIRNTDFCDTVVKQCLYSIIVQLRREYIRGYMPSRTEQLIQPAVDEIQRRFAEKDALAGDRLAALCGVSEAYFRRIFRGRFGTSPGDYVIRMRINYAKGLLRSGQHTVSQVAQLCGYAEPCHFSREFTKRVGMSPRDYQNLQTVE